MKLQEALAATGRKQTCKVADWLDSIEPEVSAEIVDALGTYEINRLYRAALQLGFVGANATWYRHFKGECRCD